MQSASTKNGAYCEKVIIRTSTGNIYDLGSPNSLLFKLRVFVYKIRRAIYG